LIGGGEFSDGQRTKALFGPQTAPQPSFSFLVGTYQPPAPEIVTRLLGNVLVGDPRATSGAPGRAYGVAGILGVIPFVCLALYLALRAKRLAVRPRNVRGFDVTRRVDASDAGTTPVP
jgi:hypothetical protein